MVEDYSLSVRAAGQKKTSTRSAANPLLQPSKNDLSSHTQPKWFQTPLSILRLEALLRPRGRSNGSRNNDSRPLFFAANGRLQDLTLHHDPE